MALVLADVGADQILKAYFNNSWPASKDFKLRLYTNDYTPVQTSVLGSFTESTAPGYTAITLSNASWTVTVGNDPSDAVYAEQTFTFTGSGATIYGYYIEDNNGSSGTLVWAERFATSFTPANNGDTIKLTPKFQLSSGTPS